MLCLGDAAPPGDITTLPDHEERAREVFGPHIGGDLIAHSPDPPDFVLARDGVVVGWAEATRAVDDDRKAFNDWLTKNAETFPAEKLSRDWSIAFHKTAVLKDVDLDLLIELFAEAEARYPDDEKTRTYDPTYPDGVMTFAKSGIWFAASWPKVDETATVTYFLAFGSSIRRSIINDLAERKAAIKADGLAACDGERHLLVVADFDAPDGEGWALSDSEKPEGVPELPEAITDVWLAMHAGLVWHYSTGNEAWNVIEP